MAFGLPNFVTNSTTNTVLKMASQVEKGKWVLWFQEAKSVITVQRSFRKANGKEPPSEDSVCRCVY
jgi:hypothetical protein